MDFLAPFRTNYSIVRVGELKKTKRGLVCCHNLLWWMEMTITQKRKCCLKEHFSLCLFRDLDDSWNWGGCMRHNGLSLKNAFQSMHLYINYAIKLTFFPLLCWDALEHSLLITFCSFALAQNQKHNSAVSFWTWNVKSPDNTSKWKVYTNKATWLRDIFKLQCS